MDVFQHTLMVQTFTLGCDLSQFLFFKSFYQCSYSSHSMCAMEAQKNEYNYEGE